MGKEKRKHFRIKYPKQDRPTTYLRGRPCPTVDLSASGMKIQCPFKIAKGSRVEGTIDFDGRSKHRFQGLVVRAMGDLIMIQFDALVKVDLLREEADYLLKRYGSLAT